MLKTSFLRELENTATIGYWSALGGVELKAINYGIEDTAAVISGAWSGSASAHDVRIYYNTERPYIRINGTRLYFDECIRV